jgi:hypothetical protein
MSLIAVAHLYSSGTPNRGYGHAHGLMKSFMQLPVYWLPQWPTADKMLRSWASKDPNNLACHCI